MRHNSCSGVTPYFCDCKILPCFLTALSFLHSLQQLSRKNTSKMKRIALMWISVILKNTRRSPLVCRCHSKGNENLLKKSFDLESNLMWTKTEYTISPIQLCFQRAFSMSWEKLEWEQETGGREISAASWILWFGVCLFVCFFPAQLFKRAVILGQDGEMFLPLWWSYITLSWN